MNFVIGGQVIQKQRLSQNMTQERLGDIVGLSSNSISRIERGLLVPSLSTFCDICNALSINADTVLAAYITADAQIRWSPLAEQMQALPPEKQDKIERILDCLIQTI